MHDARAFLPLYERVSDYLYNMSALTRREARQQWRQGIKDAWSNRCAYCGKPPIDDDSLTELTIDHVKPRSKGGEDRTSNVIPACRECNQAKSSQDWLPWYRMQPFYSIEGEWRIRQWLASGQANFGEWDEEDAKKVDEYINLVLGADWPATDNAA
jgi:hypothetical protein